MRKTSTDEHKSGGLIAGAKFWALNGGRTLEGVAELLYFAPVYNISVTYGPVTSLQG